MELLEGFIVGIFNFCDRWCETCALTSRCRLFADLARYEAVNDPAMKAVVDAPPLPEDVPPPAPKWNPASPLVRVPRIRRARCGGESWAGLNPPHIRRSGQSLAGR
jgi:hypothetical protein